MKKEGSKITYGLYCRKSTDDSDRQVLSLSSQETEASRKFGDLKTVKMPSESVSAFEPYKRPVFADLIERIKKGEIQGIIAWHPDRLARNPIDAAQIIYLLDTGQLKDLKFCSYYFDNSPEGKMMLQITLSQSKYSSDKLSKDVKRGTDRKALTGWRPGRAALGYLNSRTNLKGEQDIRSDPERFDIVKQVFQLMLTGNYTVSALYEKANNELGLRLPATSKSPSRQIHLSQLYRMLTNPFYYGWYEWTQGSGNWIEGKHQPMITEEEFDRIQFLLGRDGRPRPKTHKFAFTGMMRCGECGASITAEEKFKKQKNGNVHHYIFYHCTKKIDRNCTERSIEVKELHRQVDEIIGGITISERFQAWAIKYLHEIRTQEASAQEKGLSAKQQQLAKTVRDIDNLVLKYASSENSSGELLSDKEYQTLKGRLLRDKAALEADLTLRARNIEEWVELTEKTFNFARYARTWFAKGDLETKKAIFACLGSNLLLKDRKVLVTLREPFKIIFERLPKIEKELQKLEPVKKPLVARKFSVSVSKIPVLSG